MVSNPLERLQVALETIARGESPDMTFAARSPEGDLEACTTWFAPLDGLDKLAWLSAPSRLHSQCIDNCTGLGMVAMIAGGMREPQRKSQPCHGVSFKAEARRLSDQANIESVLGTMLTYRTFEDWEVEKYLAPHEGGVPTHGVYVATVTKWKLFDGRLGDTHPERLLYLPWPQAKTDPNAIIAG